MKLRLFVILMVLGLLPHSALAKPAILKPYLEDARPVGGGRLTYLFWNVYDATLYAPNGKWAEGAPFALELKYLIDVEGKEIAKISIEEIQKQGAVNIKTLEIWKNEMSRIFPDMKAGTSIVGIRTKAGNAVFYKDNKHIGTIKNKEFADMFFAIWVSPSTSMPELRQQLLGQK
jgi:hypothetical protein